MDEKREIERINNLMNNYEAPFVAQLRDICNAIGYGRVMQVASQLWARKLQFDDLEGGELVVGTAKAMTVPCGCKEPHKCEWCCGCGWLTKHVKTVKAGMEASEVRE